MLIESTLVQFSWAFIGAMLLLIVVPYWFRWSELVTSWNVFLLGSIVFVGTAGLVAGYDPQQFRILEYTRQDYQHYMWGVVTFFGVLTATYFLFKLPRRVGARFIRTWPPATVPVLFFMVTFTLSLAVVAILPFTIPGVSQFLFQVGNKGIAIALVLAFVAWYKQPSNLILLLTLIGVAIVSLGLAVMIGGGRRTFISVLIAVPICLYWLHLRKKRPVVNLLLLGLSGVVITSAVGAYTMIRHFDRRGEQLERTFQTSLRVVADVPSWLLDFDIEPLLGQNATQMSLAAIHLFTTDHEPEPFYSVRFVALNWIPRTIWPDKPEGFGRILPSLTRARTRATWGPGIIGHGFHEGGLHMLAFYGFIVAASLRFWDEVLKTQPGNPYILGAFAAMSGHVFGWTRGDIGTFTIQIIGCLLAALVLNFVGRFLFGGARFTTPHAYPAVWHVYPERSA